MLFYEQLIRISPTLGTRTGYAAAVGEANGPEAGLAVLDGIDPDDVSAHQPYWAVRAAIVRKAFDTGLHWLGTIGAKFFVRHCFAL